MTRRRPLQAPRCVAGLSVVAGFGLLTFASAQAPERLLITNAKILDLTAGRARPVAALELQGQKIVAVHQSSGDGPQDALTRVDAGGATLVPGLADLAVQAQPGGAMDTDFYYAMSLAHGVMHLRVVDVRLPWAAEQRDRAARGGPLAPRLWTSGPPVNMRAPLGNRLQPVLGSGLSPFVQVTDSAAAGREIQRQAKDGADWVRLGEHVTPDAVRSSLAAARAGAVRVSLSPGATSMLQASQLGVHLIDGLGSPVKPAADTTAPTVPGQDPWESPATAAPNVPSQVAAAWGRLTAADQRALVTQMVRARTPVAPLLFEMAAAARRADAAPDLQSLPPAVREAVAARAWPADERARQQAFDRARSFVLALQEAGGRLVVASGAREAWPLPGIGAHREMQWLVDAGLSPLEALRAAAVHGPEALGVRQPGRIVPGAPADFFAVEGDPLTDVGALAAITLIVRNGEVLDRAALLAQARRAVKR